MTVRFILCIHIVPLLLLPFSVLPCAYRSLTEMAEATAGMTEKKEDKAPAALHDAARRGDVDALVAALATSSGDVDERDHHRRTALHLASWTGAEAVVRALIGFGANVNAAASDGITPLHMAITKSNGACAKVLVNVGGASISMRTGRRQQTPLHLAAMHAGKRLLAEQKRTEEGAEKNDDVGKSHEADDALDIVRFLIKKKADVFAKDKAGRTAHDLTSCEQVRALLSAAEMNARASVRESSTTTFDAKNVRQTGGVKRSVRPSAGLDDSNEDDKHHDDGGSDGDESMKHSNNNKKRKKPKVALAHLEHDEEES